uniref:Putative secreted protein n=1 Tax=Ixodes ricinus TaxID=34613 RepID=A0A6B0UI96_IXORI
MSECLSTQLKKILTLALMTFCSTSSSWETFWAPRDTGSTTATTSWAGSSGCDAGIFRTLFSSPNDNTECLDLVCMCDSRTQAVFMASSLSSSEGSAPSSAITSLILVP